MNYSFLTQTLTVLVDYVQIISNELAATYVPGQPLITFVPINASDPAQQFCALNGRILNRFVVR